MKSRYISLHNKNLLDDSFGILSSNRTQELTGFPYQIVITQIYGTKFTGIYI